MGSFLGFGFGSSKENDKDKPITIDKYDTSALRNALDDSARKLMKDKLKLIESNKLMNGRLAISLLSIFVALFALLYDWLHPFPASRSVLISCVLTYFTLMGVLTLYLFYVERGIFFVGIVRDPTGLDPESILSVSSNLKRFDVKYTLNMRFFDGKSRETRTRDLSDNVTSWFNVKGELHAEPFEKMITDAFQLLVKGAKAQ
jgi:signal peptidase complex subunit 2